MRAKDLVGKRIRWEETLCRHRGTYREHVGTVTDARGRNVEVDGEWKWLPDMENLTVIPGKS